MRVCVDRCLSAETLEKLASVTECACMYVCVYLYVVYVQTVH